MAGQPLFDLTLCGHPRSFADLNLGFKELLNRGLWMNKWNGYRPWHWPLMPDAIDYFEQRITKLAKVGLEVSIFDHLELPHKLPSVMPIEVLQWFATWRIKVEDVAKVTFAELLMKSQRGLEVKDQKGTNNHTLRELPPRELENGWSVWFLAIKDLGRRTTSHWPV